MTENCPHLHIKPPGENSGYVCADCGHPISSSDPVLVATLFDIDRETRIALCILSLFTIIMIIVTIL